jgi:hypothetical protein
MRNLLKLASILPIMMLGLLLVSSQPVWAQVDPNGPTGGGACDPNAIDPHPCPSDNDPCTDEVCDATTHQCISVPVGPGGPDQCQPGGCDPNSIDPGQCPSDSDPCTTEVCDPSTHKCASVPVGPGGPDQCQPGGCDPNSIDPGQCPSDNNPCTTEVCDPSTHKCASVPVGPGGPDQCQPGGCDPNSIDPGQCPTSDNPCSPNVCNPSTHQCEAKPVVCDGDDNKCTVESCNPATGHCESGDPKHCEADADNCTTESCDPATGNCVSNPTNPAPDECGGAICRTPGFWGTHAAAASKPKSFNITQAVINAAGGTLSICGKAITSTITNDNNSAVEAICVSPAGDIRLQLARQLTAAALNCVISGGGGDCMGTPLYSTLFSSCNATCGDSSASTASITSCISQIDCLNNGGTMLANGFCQSGSCADGTPCQLEGGTACLDKSVCKALDGSCHTAALVNPDLGLSFDPPGGAGSSSLCNTALKSGCTVIGKGLTACTK